MLEATYTYCDGSIIWSSRTDENDQSVFWEDLRVQQIWEVTKHFIHSHKRQIVFPEKEKLVHIDFYSTRIQYIFKHKSPPISPIWSSDDTND